MKSITNNTMLVLFAILIATLPAFAIPMAHTEKTIIQGTIVDLKWRGQINYQEENEGFSFQRIIPSHYMVRIKMNKNSAKLLKTVSWFSKTLPIGDGGLGDDLAEDEVLVYLPTSRLDGFSSNANLIIKDYTIFTDDIGAAAQYSQILINGKVPKDIGPAFKPLPESKPTKINKTDKSQ